MLEVCPAVDVGWKSPPVPVLAPPPKSPPEGACVVGGAVVPLVAVAEDACWPLPCVEDGKLNGEVVWLRLISPKSEVPPPGTPPLVVVVFEAAPPVVAVGAWFWFDPTPNIFDAPLGGLPAGVVEKMEGAGLLP
jgi:hypothetical protein